MSFKRSATTEGCLPEDGVPEAKSQRMECLYVLGPEPQLVCDEDSNETVFSVQSKETDVAKDTSDTSSQTEWSSEEDFTMKVEYEIASQSERENPLGDGSLSSDTDHIVYAAAAAATVMDICREEFSSYADDSGNSDSNAVYDREIPRADYWTCLRCKNKNNNPLFRYCEKCYKRQICVQCNQSKEVPCFPICFHCFKLRKDFFPPRPRRRRKRRKNSNKKPPSLEKSTSTASTVSLTEDRDKSMTAGPSFLHLDSGLGSSQDMSSAGTKSEVDSQDFASASNSTEDLSSQTCITCMTNPKNGLFVHGKIGHLCCCYKCALKVWTQTGKCPICNSRVRNILKVIVQ